MSVTLAAEITQDPLAVLLAGVIAKANQRARELGVDVRQSLVSISQCDSESESHWRINYGPKDYVGTRGGDLIIDVDPGDLSVTKILWGQ